MQGRWLILGILAVFIESSLLNAPWLIAWAWLASVFLAPQQIVWPLLGMGLLLDILQVMPVGASSLILILISAAFILERKLFSSLAVDLIFLILALGIWGVYRGQSWWLIGLVTVITIGAVRLLGPKETGVVLRRL